jgi:hypothetical protein
MTTKALLIAARARYAEGLYTLLGSLEQSSDGPERDVAYDWLYERIGPVTVYDHAHTRTQVLAMLDEAIEACA